MPRRYRHMQDYEKEIIELINQGNTLREIGNKLGFTHKQMRDFKTRYNKKQRKIEAGKTVHKKGRPCKKDGELICVKRFVITLAICELDVYRRIAVAD